jgi:hypothetical protein
MKTPLACLAALWCALPLLPARAAGYDVLVCYPGGPVKDEQAEGAMGDMLKTLEAEGGFPAGTFRHEFTTKLETCRAKLAAKNPQFVILSLGLFLEAREKHHLLPLVQPRIKGKQEDTYRIVVQKGRHKDLASLQGKRLGGSVLEEVDFLRRVVFQGQLDPRTHFQLKPQRRVLRDLKALAKGELDAVMLNQIQYDGLGSLPFGKDLEAIFASPPMPLVGLAIDETRVPAADRKKMTDALTRMCTQGEGAKLCELFGVEAFVPVPADAYAQVIGRWSQAK